MLNIRSALDAQKSVFNVDVFHSLKKVSVLKVLDECIDKRHCVIFLVVSLLNQDVAGLDAFDEQVIVLFLVLENCDIIFLDFFQYLILLLKQ